MYERGDTERLPHALLSGLPEMPKNFKSREAQIAWIREKAILPMVSVYLTERIVAVINTDENGRVSVEAHPADLFTLTLLTLVSMNQLLGMKECACGCGELAPPGRKYVNKTHARRNYEKQNVLSVYRNWKNKGKMTVEQYRSVHEALNRAAKAGTSDYDGFAAVARSELDMLLRKT